MDRENGEISVRMDGLVYFVAFLFISSFWFALFYPSKDNDDNDIDSI